MSRTRTRPGPIRWLLYAVGRPLPDEMREWVRRDVAGPGAPVRHVLRSQVLFVPIYLAFLLLPGPAYVRVLMVLLSVLLSAFYTVAYMDQNRARRLEQHGLEVDLSSARSRRRHEAEREAYERTHGHR
ncbi:DUF5313 domain-containing protein [Rhodococcus aerolatus]